ncbi:hypothetical protein RND61_14735 [Streptomyces sp. TRM76323]|uniref:Uncharacterized protein n=1 Tax=Streptomyces tamarix TaxID=3078565 RepID=A0ABU3QKR6_9ACTN|nr:hypothetical protein [Streptomyces tamarix]MDT9683319.1 hypothetical protein [Streptomyces tamarix]
MTYNLEGRSIYGESAKKTANYFAKQAVDNIEKRLGVSLTVSIGLPQLSSMYPIIALKQSRDSVIKLLSDILLKDMENKESVSDIFRVIYAKSSTPSDFSEMKPYILGTTSIKVGYEPISDYKTVELLDERSFAFMYYDHGTYKNLISELDNPDSLRFIYSYTDAPE